MIKYMNLLQFCTVFLQFDLLYNAKTLFRIIKRLETVLIINNSSEKLIKVQRAPSQTFVKNFL